MLKLKNLLCCTMSVILMLSLMSCSVVEKLNSHYESDLVIDQTENVSVSETVIKALENNDADAIKNLFSVRAKDLCPDLDEGIDICSAYMKANLLKLRRIIQAQINIRAVVKDVLFLRYAFLKQQKTTISLLGMRGR